MIYKKKFPLFQTVHFPSSVPTVEGRETAECGDRRKPESSPSANADEPDHGSGSARQLRRSAVDQHGPAGSVLDGRTALRSPVGENRGEA